MTTAAQPHTRGALEGLKVLDFSTTIAGPYCGRMLADTGAQVIKIESGDGEVMRHRLPIREGCSTVFGQLNAGKKSIALDLKCPSGGDIAKRLIADSDVLVENFRPGVMQRLGLDYAAVRDLNPRLVYCSISGYGQTGPSSQLAAYAPVIHAASGYDLAHLAYQPGRDRPDNCGLYLADVLAGVYAYGAIASALYQRERNGRGQHIDVSMLEAMLAIPLNEIQFGQFGVAQPSRPMFGPMATADGYIMVAISSERTFRGFVTAAGHPEWIEDPRFKAYADRRDNWGELMDEIESWSRQLPSRACLAALDAHGVPCSPYRTVDEALADPQLAHRGALAEVEDDAGPFRVMNLPFRMSEAQVRAGSRAPSLNEHATAVLRHAGFSADEIETLGLRASA